MFNKSEIMRRAHEIARKGTGGYRVLFAMALRQAWGEARRAGRTTVERIRESLLVLDCKDMWTPTDYAQHTALMNGLREAA